MSEENARVEETIRALERGDLDNIGQLLNASHESSRTLFQNSCAELDELVELLVPLPGVYGARLSGGGFGGAVMALTDGNRAFSENGAAVKESYARKFGTAPRVFQTRLGRGAGIVSS